MSSSRHSCWICHNFAAPTLKAVIRHIGAVHGYDPNFFICYGINGCPPTYNNFHSFRQHFRRKHIDLDMEEYYDLESSYVHVEDTADNESAGVLPASNAMGDNTRYV